MRYVRPSTVEQAVAGLAEGGHALAGGTVLVPLLLSQAAQPSALWDLQQLSDLSSISTDTDAVCIGAMVSLAALSSSPVILAECAALAEAALAVGNPQVRNAATLGGNIASPHTDLPPALLALDAEITLAKQDGVLTEPLEQFLTTGTKGLIMQVRLPRRKSRRSRFIKFAWRASSGRTIASVAGTVTLDDGKVAEARFVCAGVADKPARLTAVENALVGREPTQALFRQAAGIGSAGIVFQAAQPPREEYRRHLVEAGILQILKDLAIA